MQIFASKSGPNANRAELEHTKTDCRYQPGGIEVAVTLSRLNLPQMAYHLAISSRILQERQALSGPRPPIGQGREHTTVQQHRSHCQVSMSLYSWGPVRLPQD